MGSGAITGYFDVAQIVLYGFWIFFAGLIYYLLRENKREGYPLESERSGGRIRIQGWPRIPKPKSFKLRTGGTFLAPSPGRNTSRPVAAVPIGPWPGAPLQPTGNPMLDGVGPAAYADRADVPDVTVDGAVKIVPLRAAPGYGVFKDPDPRGLKVIGADGAVGGTVSDLWVDRSEAIFRYLEVEVAVAGGSKRVLLPHNFARIGDKQVSVRSILASQFADVPATKHPDQVTFLEEDKIMGYYGGGTLYAKASRQEPLL